VPALNAMRTAERVFATTHTRADLLVSAIDALASQPGQMCLVSLVDGEALRPAGVAHALSSRTGELRELINHLGKGDGADAFSRAAQTQCSPVRMRIGDPALLELWLPDPYWDYARRTSVSTVMAAPLAVRNKVLGTFLLWREGEGASPYTASDQAYVAGLAARLALALKG